MNLLFFVCELYLIEVKTIARMIFHSHKEVSKSLPYRFYKSFQKYKLILTFDLHFCTFIETPDLLFYLFFFLAFMNGHTDKKHANWRSRLGLSPSQERETPGLLENHIIF